MPSNVTGETQSGGSAVPDLMTTQEAAWVRVTVWPAWMKALDDDYPGRGCFLFHLTHCRFGVCVPCRQDPPRHDRCLTRQHDGRPHGWDMAIYAWSDGCLHGRRVADVWVKGRRGLWRCPCGCWDKPLPPPPPPTPRNARERRQAAGQIGLELFGAAS